MPAVNFDLMYQAMVRNKGTFNQTSSRMDIRGNFLISNFSSVCGHLVSSFKGAFALDCVRSPAIAR
jgi:hypothetical protein